MTTSVEIINTKTYDERYKGEVGSLLFPEIWYDCLGYVDKKKLRQNFKDQLPKGARIVKVLIPTDTNPLYKNIGNPLIPYATAVCASKDQDGAYYKEYPEMNFAMWASNYPVGDAIIVYK